MGNALFSECCRTGVDSTSRTGSEIPPPWLLPRGKQFLSKDASIQTGTDLFDFLHQSSLPTSLLRSDGSSTAIKSEKYHENSMDRCFLFCHKNEVCLFDIRNTLIP